MACGSCGGGRVGISGSVGLSGVKVVYVNVPRSNIEDYNLDETFGTEIEARVAAAEGYVSRAIVVSP